jgi:hypothetical protein
VEFKVQYLMTFMLTSLLLTGVPATGRLCYSAFPVDSQACLIDNLTNQDLSTGIIGKVSRPDGVEISAAFYTITFRSEEGKTARSGCTDFDGTYSASSIPPGFYDVEVKVAGYKKATRKQVQVLPGLSLTHVNFVLKPGKGKVNPPCQCCQALY